MKENEPSDARYRIGVDVGGTFTDGILVDEHSGETRIAKVPSTPGDPSVSFLAAVERILHEAGIEASDAGYLVHGTTVATNAIIEGKLAPTGFITTEGFRDMLEIQRQIRPSLYDLLFEKPRPLAPRYLCFGIPERLDAAGAVVTPLDEEAVAAAARQLKHEGGGGVRPNRRYRRNTAGVAGSERGDSSHDTHREGNMRRLRLDGFQRRRRS